MIVKYAKDVRYDEEGIATHCGMKIPATVSTTRLELITNNILTALNEIRLVCPLSSSGLVIR